MSTTTYIDIRNDTYTSQGSPNTEYKTSNDLISRSEAVNFNRRSYIEFSLVNLPRPYCNLESLTLEYRLQLLYGTQTTMDFNWLLDYDWGSDTVTWNNPLTTAGTSFSVIENGGLEYRDVLDYVNFLNAKFSYIGWEIKYETEESSTLKAIYYDSSESGEDDAFTLKVVMGDYTTQVTSDVINYDPLESEYAPWFKGHALEVWYTDHNVAYTEFEVKVLLPWDSWTDTKTTISGLAYQTWSSTYTSGDLKWRCYIYFASSGSPPTIRIYEQYWTGDDLYVKTDGNNSLDGRSWANAWKTITVAANNVIDDQTVHIGFGTYNDETDITPDNFSTIGIRYLPETATTGGGTGSVTINL